MIKLLNSHKIIDEKFKEVKIGALEVKVSIKLIGSNVCKTKQ